MLGRRRARREVIGNPAVRRYVAEHGPSEHQFTLGTQWLLAAGELPDDELDRVLSDPRRPGAGEEIRDMGEE